MTAGTTAAQLTAWPLRAAGAARRSFWSAVAAADSRTRLLELLRRGPRQRVARGARRAPASAFHGRRGDPPARFGTRAARRRPPGRAPAELPLRCLSAGAPR